MNVAASLGRNPGDANGTCRQAVTKPQNDPDQNPTRRQQPGAQGAGQEADALDEAGNVDEGKLRKNQERLEVDPEHKTPTMRKRHRGTFP